MEIFGQVLLYLGAVLAIGFGVTALTLKIKKKNNILPWLIVAISGLAIAVIGGASWGSYKVGYQSGVKSAKKPLSNEELQTIANLYGDDDDSGEHDDGEEPTGGDETVKFGDSIEYGDNGLEITVKSAKKTSSDGFDDKPVVPVEVTITLANKSSKSIKLNQHEFDLYDSKDEQGAIDPSSFGNENADSLAAGKKATWKLHYSAKNDGPFSVSYNSEYTTDTWE